METVSGKKRKLPLLYVVGTLSFIAVFIISRGILKAVELPPEGKIIVALLPLPAFILFILGFIKNIRESDELEQKIHLEALSIAFPLTLMLIFTLGFIELAIPLPKDDFSYRHVGFFIPAIYFGSLAYARWRYR